MPVVELAAHGGPEVLVPATRPVPVPAADQLLVRVGACGVCGHDALARRGLLAAPVGSVLGHEIAGRVEAAGADVTGWVGRRVALVQRIPCGVCAECAAGTTARCRQGPGFYGEDLPGGYAGFVLASPLNAVPLPDEVDDVTGALLSCAVGTGLKALHTAGVRAGDVVVVRLAAPPGGDCPGAAPRELTAALVAAGADVVVGGAPAGEPGSWAGADDAAWVLPAPGPLLLAADGGPVDSEVVVLRVGLDGVRHVETVLLRTDAFGRALPAAAAPPRTPPCTPSVSR